MLSTILSFFGGSVFRMLWGEISSFISSRQNHRHELEMMKLQGELQAEQHARNLAAIELQRKLGVEVIRVQGDADVSRAEADAWAKAVEGTTKQTGIWLVDLWNGLVRPVLASICIGLVVLHFWRAGWVLDEQGWSLVGAVLGIYVADRTLFKRGK
jgi:hypothetical protein